MGNSTQTALIKLMDDVRLAVDNRSVILLILFDFTKTFNSVQHSLLLDKLSRMHISKAVLDWFASYLSG